MAVTKSPITNHNTSSSFEDFDRAVALIADKLTNNQSQFWSDRMATVAAGLIKPSKQQFDALRLMFDKKVPDAPKDINLNENKKIEVVFKNFLEENPMNFGNALMEAQESTKRELMITQTLESDEL